MYLNHPFDDASLSQLIGLHKLALAPKGVKTMEKNGWEPCPLVAMQAHREISVNFRRPRTLTTSKTLESNMSNVNRMPWIP